MSAWWSAAVAVGAMVVGGWALRRIESRAGRMGASSEAWLACAREREARDPSRFADVLDLSDDDLGEYRCVVLAERAVRVAWRLEPAVCEAVAVVRESRRRIGHLYVQQ